MSESAVSTAEEKKAKLKALLKSKQSSKPTSVDLTKSQAQNFTRPSLEEGIQALEHQRQQLQALEIPPPFFRPLTGLAPLNKDTNDREIINFSNYNYLGLSGDERVNKAAQDAISIYGTSVGASRVISGERPIHRQLERAIADFVGQEDAMVMVGGFGTNESIIGNVCDSNDLILHDALMHRSAIDGAILSGARRMPYPHNDLKALEKLLTEHRSKYRQCLILTEGLFSMDGDILNLPEIVNIKNRHNALLFVDEAHSLGVLGKNGKGIAEHWNIDPKEIDLWMGTFSKSLASCGGALAARADIIEYLKYTTPGFVYSVGISPANAAAAIESLKILNTETWRVEQAQKNGRYFWEQCKENEIDTGLSEGYSVTPIIIGHSEKALILSQKLFIAGINVQPILAPAVPEHEVRIRCFITAQHNKQQMDKLINQLKNHLN